MCHNRAKNEKSRGAINSILFIEKMERKRESTTAVICIRNIEKQNARIGVTKSSPLPSIDDIYIEQILDEILNNLSEVKMMRNGPYGIEFQKNEFMLNLYGRLYVYAFIIFFSPFDFGLNLGCVLFFYA